MMQKFSLFALVSLWFILGCTPSNSDAPLNTSSPFPPTEPLATPTSFVFEIDASSFDPSTSGLSNIDRENQRLIDQSLSSVQDSDTVRIQFIATIVFNNGNDYAELILSGQGVLFGLSARASNFGFDIQLDGEINANDQPYHVIVDLRLTSGQVFTRVFANNFNSLNEVVQTPWLALDLEALFENLFNDELFETDVNMSVDSPNLPEIEDFFGFLSFNDYILTRRLPNVGAIAVFERDFDIPAFVGSSDFLQFLMLSDEISDVGIVNEEFEQLILILPELIQAIFPQLQLRFLQEVNLNDTTLNKLTVDFDLEADVNVLNQLNMLPPNMLPARNIFLNIDVVVTFSAFGQSVSVPVPDEYIPLSDYEIVPLPTSEGR